MAKYYCSPPEPTQQFCNKYIFNLIKFVIKLFAIFLLVIAFLKTLYNLVNQLNDFTEYTKDIENNEIVLREAYVMACAQHMLYVPILLMATFGVFMESYRIVLLFSSISLILNIDYIWNFSQLLFLSIDFSLVLISFVLTLIYYRENKHD